LANLDASLAGRILLIDKAVFPRHKLCAGGLTNSADIILATLGVDIAVPSMPVHRSKLLLRNGTLTLNQPNQFRVVHRTEFDESLFRAASARGIVTHDGEALTDLNVDADGVVVQTSKNLYKTKMIIGSDGANSTVRRLLGMSRESRLMMAIETYVPVSEIRLSDLDEHIAIFDFTMTSADVPGYCWVFPTAHDSRMFSLGIMESPFEPRRRISLKTAFRHWLANKAPNAETFSTAAHPALRYEPRAKSSSYRVLLTGDSAGVDPLFGEGITSALGLGVLAAQIAQEALTTNNFYFNDYDRRVRSSLVGSMMRRRRTIARRLYTEHPARLRMQHVDLLDWIAPIGSTNTRSSVTWEAAV
jgi:menaquinone-9 beta-reductase